MRILIDAHLDLAMNAIYYERDITLGLDEMNQAESHLQDLPFRGRGTTTLPELREANAGVCFATLLARSSPGFQRADQMRRSSLDHSLRDAAHCSGFAQLAYYRLLERRGEIRLLTHLEDLNDHIEKWTAMADHSCFPVGVVLTMEGADPILGPEELDLWYAEGLRAIGLTHYGFSHYGGGTRTEGPLTPHGKKLLERMYQLNMAVDVTHLSDRSMQDVFDCWEGTLWASHHNARSLVPGDRQLSDGQILFIAGRDGVIGVAADAIMLHPDWKYLQSDPEELDVRIREIVRQIDYLIDLTGDTKSVGIGTDLDGGFGREQSPLDLQAYRDIRKIEDQLTGRGYSDQEIDAIFSGNWLRMLRKILPTRNHDGIPLFRN